jgi:hypothetical protein
MTLLSGMQAIRSLRVPTAPALRRNVDFQIEIVPAGGTSAANY